MMGMREAQKEKDIYVYVHIGFYIEMERGREGQ